jgi:methionyl-tRNA formyltransferase
VKVIFISTPEFGLPTLRGLVREKYDIVGVVCQPDKPAGRGQQLTAPPIKRAALELGLPVLQFVSLRQPEAFEQLRALRPDLVLVAAYGQYIPTEIIALPPRGCFNIHPSLLPRWRGASPVAAAILAGDVETGVTIQFVVAQMDAGDIIAQERTPIGEDETTGMLTARLAEWGASIYLDAIAHWLRGEITPRVQDHSQAIWCDRLKKSQGLLDWNRSAEELARQVRAFQPWPGAYTHWRGQQLDVLEGAPLRDWRGAAAPGTVMRIDAGIAVAAGQGALLLRRVQLAGKRALAIDEFTRGARDFVGSVLGMMDS